MISIKLFAGERLRKLGHRAGPEVTDRTNHREEAYYQETVAEQLGKN